MPTTAENLIRKQIMLSPSNIKKLEKLSKDQGTSAAEIVRQSIDSFDPDAVDIEEDELKNLVAERLKEAIAETAKTRKRLNKVIKTLEKKGR
jgi:predicted component of type VI protein secretion system